MLTGATAGVNSFAGELAGLGGALLALAVVICALIIATKVGGQGIQKDIRQLGITLGVCAFILRGYQALTTGTLALFGGG